MNGLTAAKGLRRSVENAGGLMRISVPALGDAFGRGKLTTRAKAGIEGVLVKAGLEVVPSLTDPAGDGWVTLRVATGAPAQLPQVASGGAAHLRPAPFLAAALAFLVPVLLIVAFVSPDANRPGRADAGETQTAKAAPATPAERAEDALLAGDYRTAVRFAGQAGHEQETAMRRRVSTALTTQARTAQRGRAYVRAIKLARRAARFGPAPGASAIVRQSRAGLDLRREAQRRAERARGGG